MSEWAYRKCPDCGQRTHINCYCSKCGGDPWGREKEIQTYLAMLKQDKEKLLLRIERLDQEIEIQKKYLPSNKGGSNVFVDIKNAYPKIKEHLLNEFMFNTPQTRATVIKELEFVINGRPYRVKCDEENNPPDVIDDNDLILEISWVGDDGYLHTFDIHFGKEFNVDDSIVP